MLSGIVSIYPLNSANIQIVSMHKYIKCKIQSSCVAAEHCGVGPFTSSRSHSVLAVPVFCSLNLFVVPVYISSVNAAVKLSSFL